jgi:glycosyltransferase 2 family protein
MSKKQLFRYSYRLLGLLILAYLLIKLDYRILYNHLREIRLWPLLLSVILVVPMTVGKAIRWQVFLKDHHIHLSLRDSLVVYFKGYALGTITPGQIGELIKTYEVKRLRPDASKERVFMTIVNDRIYDLSMLWLCCLPAFIWGRMPFHAPAWLVAIMILVSVIFAYYPNLPLFPFKKKLSYGLNTRYAFNFGLSLAITAVIMWRSVLIFQALNVTVPLVQILLYLPWVNIISLLPISISGFGTREAILVYFFTPFQVSTEQMVLVGLLMGLIFFILNGVIGSIFMAVKH